MTVAHTEIERAFEVRELPRDLGPASSIEQHYIALDRSVHVRIRREGDRCSMTVKGGRGRERTEVEVSIDSAQFDALAALGTGRSIEKQRHRVELSDGLVAEVDLFGGPLAGLALVEVEFDDHAAAESFVPPPWFGDEVTDRPGWTNAELAIHGRPPT